MIKHFLFNIFHTIYKKLFQIISNYFKLFQKNKEKERSNMNYKQMRNKTHSKYKSMKVKSKPKNNKNLYRRIEGRHR